MTHLEESGHSKENVVKNIFYNFCLFNDFINNATYLGEVSDYLSVLSVKRHLGDNIKNVRIIARKPNVRGISPLAYKSG